MVVLATSCAAVEGARQVCEARSDVATATCVEVNRPQEPIGLAVVEREGVRRLQVRFPDTDTLLGGVADDRTLAGPVAVAVTAAGGPLPCSLASERCAAAAALPTGCLARGRVLEGSCSHGDALRRRLLVLYPQGVYGGGMISDIKRRSLHRAKILEGQMRGLQKMIDNEEYCMDILTQSLAIQKSLSSLNKLVLENHIRTHIKESLSSGSNEAKDKAVDELISLYELSNVRSKQ